MEKKTIIIISLFSAIISLIYILLNYFGVLRYLGISMFSSERYIKKYSKLDQIDKDKKVVISLIATDKELKKIPAVIRSLLDQTVKVNLISIVLPYDNIYNLPDDLKNSVVLFRTKINYGDLNSIIPTAIREGEDSTQIITIGADKIYGKDFIEQLLEKSKKNPQHIIYCNNKDELDIREGVLFPINVFSEDFFNPPKKVFLQHTSVKNWINNFFKYKPKKKIKYKENLRY